MLPRESNSLPPRYVVNSTADAVGLILTIAMLGVTSAVGAVPGRSVEFVSSATMMSPAPSIAMPAVCEPGSTNSVLLPPRNEAYTITMGSMTSGRVRS